MSALRGTIALLALACGALAANVYLAQPLAGPIAATIGLPPQAAGWVVTLTQLGYGLGLLLLVPLADRIENRRLILSLVALAGLSLALAAVARQAGVYLAASLGIGLGSVCVQVLVPYAAHVAPEKARGTTVGLVTAGLMLGILLARPAAGLIAEALAWPAVFASAGVLMCGLFILLALRLPKRRPNQREPYASVLRSMLHAPFRYALLRRRIVYQSALFGGFSLFWTAVPLWLMQPGWGWSEGAVGLFSLTAASGALAAPMAGALADRGHGDRVTCGALAMAASGFALAAVAWPSSPWSVAALVSGASMINAAVTFSFVVGQRAIFELEPGARARLNGIFMASFTLAGAAASALGGWLLVHTGWTVTACCGVAFLIPALAQILCKSEKDAEVL